MTDNTTKKARILVVDDVADNIRMLVEILKDEFATIPATSGEMALQKLATTVFDLVLLDIMMPDLDGYEVCRAIKSNPDTADIPVIFITAVSEAMDDARGFTVGGDDYISKPFNPSTVKARVRHQIKLRQVIKELEELYQVALDNHPISGLPGNNTIRNRIATVIKKRAGVVVVYADLDNFKAFNDNYGFALGDDVLRFAADTLKTVMNRVVSADGFLGHIDGDDFVMLIPLELLDQICDEIILRFDEGIRQFYNKDDLDNGFITSTSRSGDVEQVPIMSISMAGVNLTQTDYGHYLTVIDACMEMKEVARNEPGSIFVLDQRVG